MVNLNFPSLWHQWIKECLSSTEVSILVIGSPTDEFTLLGWLRQGDPLSPFLFLLAVKGLNSLMCSIARNNLSVGYCVSSDEDCCVSRLQFTDNTNIMRVKSWATVRGIKSIMLLFELTSSLNVNFHKSFLVGLMSMTIGLGKRRMCYIVRSTMFLLNIWVWLLEIIFEG